MNERVITFLRKKDFVFIRELGQGSCGKTVLLHDRTIDEFFVCKKFSPQHPALKVELYQGFVREIKFLHMLNHPNIVRVFNYYLYPEQQAGYILMEQVVGSDIDDFLIRNPGQATHVFEQIIDAFLHLEKQAILHRDIRPANILISNDQTAKIIDFGFGKQTPTEQDFAKSITLNWWCESPAEFADHIYNTATEIYFIGKLFEKIIRGTGFETFGHKEIIAAMCETHPSNRIATFAAIRQRILTGQFGIIEFSDEELSAYRAFANGLTAAIAKIAQSAKYYDDYKEVEEKLNKAYKTVMLEAFVPDNSIVLRCVIDGGYHYSRKNLISVSSLNQFLQLLKASSTEKRYIILNNLLTRLDATPRYDPDPFDDDIPF